MINAPSLDERNFQRFFQRHPQFLLAYQYDTYWAEPRLTSRTAARRISPDFVLQPVGGRENGWNWNIVDLKRHNVPLLTGRSGRANLSSHVHRVVTQLQNYRAFFEDPRNHQSLGNRFGGVRPSPKLTAIIGRLPISPDDRAEFSTLVRRIPDVEIRSYDEVLLLRKASVDRILSIQRT
jgi:hypothetical protein